MSQILACLHEDEHSEAAIEFAVTLARQVGARLRGLTLFDSTSLEEQVRTCESAAPVVLEMARLQKLEDRYRELRQAFSTACLGANLDFDLRQERGRPREILTAQARCHDLTIASLPLRRSWCGFGLSGTELLDLVHHGVQPLIIHREGAALPRRVLLVHAGTAACDKAFKSFLSQSLFPQAEVRLLAVQPRTEDAQLLLRQVSEHARAIFPDLETGCAAGQAQGLAPEYARHWNADLVVLGAPRSPILSRALYGETIHNVLKLTSCAVYAAS